MTTTHIEINDVATLREFMNNPQLPKNALVSLTVKKLKDSSLYIKKDEKKAIVHFLKQHGHQLTSLSFVYCALDRKAMIEFAQALTQNVKKHRTCHFEQVPVFLHPHYIKADTLFSPKITRGVYGLNKQGEDKVEVADKACEAALQKWVNLPVVAQALQQNPLFEPSAACINRSPDLYEFLQDAHNENVDSEEAVLSLEDAIAFEMPQLFAEEHLDMQNLMHFAPVAPAVAPTSRCVL